MERIDVIKLTVPSDPRYASVARIVVGGLAARLDLSYEALDDIQLAVESVLAADSIAAARDVSLEVSVLEGQLAIAIGPLDRGAAENGLERASSGELGLAALLRAVVDRFQLADRDAGSWLVLEKRVPWAPAS